VSLEMMNEKLPRNIFYDYCLAFIQIKQAIPFSLPVARQCVIS
jgi:hypothetical protein